MAKSERRMATASSKQIVPLGNKKAVSSGKHPKNTKKGRNVPTVPTSMSVQNLTGVVKETDINILRNSGSRKKYVLAGNLSIGTGGADVGNDIPATVSTRLMEVDQVRSCASARKVKNSRRQGVFQGTPGQVTSSIRSAGHLTTMISDITTVNENQWAKIKRNFEDNLEQTTREVDRFTKTGLFKGLKFITERDQMDYSAKSKSICQTVCKTLHIPLDDSYKFWNKYGRLVAVILNRKRADVNSAIKKAFIGKCFQYLM
jgi:hypothetical protein